MINAQEIMAQLSPNQTINFDRILKKMIVSWTNESVRPKILLHSCCAPCSTYTLEYLSQYADIGIYFSNSNIHPESEYKRRELVQQQFVEQFNQQTNQSVQFLAAPYEPSDFIKIVKENNVEDEPEGKKRCQLCFQMRLDLVAQKAKDLNYDYFGSALTLSPKKNSQLINSLGLTIQEELDILYLPSDFKKNNGYKRSIELCREYDIYRQCYCGCSFAAKQQGVNLSEVHSQAKRFLSLQSEVE